MSGHDGYQTNLRWAFDPIALRLSISNDRLASDVTVMPLIAGSEYGQLLAVFAGRQHLTVRGRST